MGSLDFAVQNILQLVHTALLYVFTQDNSTILLKSTSAKAAFCKSFNRLSSAASLFLLSACRLFCSSLRF